MFFNERAFECSSFITRNIRGGDVDSRKDTSNQVVCFLLGISPASEV